MKISDSFNGGGLDTIELWILDFERTAADRKRRADFDRAEIGRTATDSRQRADFEHSDFDRADSERADVKRADIEVTVADSDRRADFGECKQQGVNDEPTLKLQ